MIIPYKFIRYNKTHFLLKELESIDLRNYESCDVFLVSSFLPSQEKVKMMELTKRDLNLVIIADTLSLFKGNTNEFFEKIHKNVKKENIFIYIPIYEKDLNTPKQFVDYVVGGLLSRSICGFVLCDVQNSERVLKAYYKICDSVSLEKPVVFYKLKDWNLIKSRKYIVLDEENSFAKKLYYYATGEKKNRFVDDKDYFEVEKILYRIENG